MQRRSIIRCALILGLVGMHAAGAVRIGELDVREGKAGEPCFTIPESEELRAGAPDFQSISVAESGPGGKAVMWNMTMPKARTFPVSFRMCIPYAGRLPVLPQTPAAALQPERAYDVTIEVHPGPQAGAPRSYRARFCLAPEGKGVLRVRKLGAGTLESKARRGCASPSP